MQFFRHNVTGGTAEIGVLDQYIDGKLYLVDDTLSVGLVARPQFQVRKTVIQTITVFVMHAFKFCQRATEMFRHYIAVQQDFAAAAKMQAHVSGRVHMPVGVDRAPRASFPAAFFAAEFLAFVISALAAIFGAAHTAFFGDAAQLALKSRSGFFVHGEQLPDSFDVVNGIFGARNFQIITYTGG